MIGFGDGGSLSLGADGGPIYSSDQYDTDFNTGSFSLKGGSGSALNQVSLVVAGIAIGVVLWLLVSSR